MKKVYHYYLLTCLFFFAGMMLVNAQDVIFCERVDQTGNPVNQSTSFKIGKAGGFFNVLFRQKNSVNCEEATFDIYFVEKEKAKEKETFMSSVKMKVNPDANWFFKEITFFKPGLYRVYIYSEKDRILGAGKVEIGRK